MHDGRQYDDGTAGPAELVAKGIAAGRVAFGVACLLAPRAVLGPSGRTADGPMVYMARLFGVRDIVLGAGTLSALQGNGPNRVQWVRFSAMADTLDLVAAATFRNELDRAGRRGVFALALPAAVGGWWSGAQMERA